MDKHLAYNLISTKGGFVLHGLWFYWLIPSLVHESINFKVQCSAVVTGCEIC